MGKKVFLPSLLALALLAAALAFTLWQGQSADALRMEANATVGEMPGLDPAARASQLQTLVDESLISYSVNTHLSVEKGRGNLLLENPKNNQKYLIATLRLDATGELLYQSGALVPGSYLEWVPLSATLPKGEHPATLYLDGYRLTDEGYLGQTGVAVTLVAA